MLNDGEKKWKVNVPGYRSKKTEGVTECRDIREAFVPLTKLYFDGIDMDILFAQLANNNKVQEDQDLRLPRY
ncbi:Oidioi.mRNA.OKI2018_I69.YSR.g17125.t1.cds [Oikopleura dioica]|uniref:Oidioi.mRNA.OKI2018_I69.YSR.g17125.t1.cds n=1 Tax=Oikopleura dioica TaxID=34765 RepID=A0ABN7SPJ7_OIKDI|nr:Oidioi.mRNA.OKI2018_I69.YSR.g17125.t1.cds [Oikopleura dioica]